MTSRKFTPQVYSGRGPLTAVELPPEYSCHVRAGEYLEYANQIRYPKPFVLWLEEMEFIAEGRKPAIARYIAGVADDPYCRSPSKMRRHGPKKVRP